MIEFTSSFRITLKLIEFFYDGHVKLMLWFVVFTYVRGNRIVTFYILVNNWQRKHFIIYEKYYKLPFQFQASTISCKLYHIYCITQQQLRSMKCYRQ